MAHSTVLSKQPYYGISKTAARKCSSTVPPCAHPAPACAPHPCRPRLARTRAPHCSFFWIFFSYMYVISSDILRLCRVLQWLGHFYYSDLANFLLQWLSHFIDSVIHFATVTRPFLDFVGHFWVFVAGYSDLAISATMTQSFFRFCQSFLCFHHALRWLSHFLDFVSYFFDISSCVPQWLSHFCNFVSNPLDFISHSYDFVRHYRDFTKSFFSAAGESGEAQLAGAVAGLRPARHGWRERGAAAVTPQNFEFWNVIRIL
jgi:hypothetical protein